VTDQPSAPSVAAPPAPPAAPASPMPRTGGWQQATVVGIRPETANAKTFRLALTEPRPHLAGQHYVVRLTAPDGYRASRSYSIASPPDDSGQIELTIERLEDGEVSSFLHDDLMLVRLVVSARSPGDLYYAAELPGPETTIVYTRAAPPSWPRPPGHLNALDLPSPLTPGATAYVCGSSGFADAATALLTDAGVAVDHIRVERFGPSG
jgi:ferredoxin-NADP reductase